METPETDAGLIDCGQVSRKTHDLPFPAAVLNGFVPFNTLRFHL